MRENEKLITIARFENSFEADLAKLALEQENIPCHLAGVGVAVNIAYPAVISIQLQVFESDAERAQDLLDNPLPLDETDLFEETE